MTTLAVESPFLSLMAQEAASLVERLRRSLVAVRGHRGGGGGSGIIWSEDGLIITNSHVMGGERAEVLTWDERVLAGRLVARDPERDLAAVRVDADGLPAAEIGDSGAVRVGELVLAVGNPWGQRGALTAGIILSAGGHAPEHRVPLADAIRADVRLAPGNSGGPLADARGRVIGVNAMITGGVAVAVPSNLAARFVDGDVPGQGFLGIAAQPVPLPPAIAAAARSEDGAGLLLTEVTDGSPAARAGLLPGDVLVGLDGSRRLEALAGRLRRLRPGSPVTLDLLRAGAPRTIEAVPVARV